MDNVYQQVQATQEGDQHIEELEGICKPIELLIEESIASTLPKRPAKASEEQAIDQEAANEHQVIEVPHIDFVFGDRSLMHSDCVQPVEIQKLMHQMVRSHSKASSRFHKQWIPHSTSLWKTCLKLRVLIPASKSCQEVEDQEAHRGFVRLIFDPRGLL